MLTVPKYKCDQCGREVDIPPWNNESGRYPRDWYRLSHGGKFSELCSRECLAEYAAKP